MAKEEKSEVYTIKLSESDKAYSFVDYLAVQRRDDLFYFELVNVGYISDEEKDDAERILKRKPSVRVIMQEDLARSLYSLLKVQLRVEENSEENKTE